MFQPSNIPIQGTLQLRNYYKINQKYIWKMLFVTDHSGWQNVWPNDVKRVEETSGGPKRDKWLEFCTFCGGQWSGASTYFFWKSRWDQDRSRWWNENHMIERRQKETEAWNFVASVIVNQHRETSGAALQSKKWLLRDRLAFGEFWHLPVASCIVNLVRGERELADHGTAWTNLSSASLSTKLFSFLGCTTFMFLSKSKKNNKT